MCQKTKISFSNYRSVYICTRSFVCARKPKRKNNFSSTRESRKDENRNKMNTPETKQKNISEKEEGENKEQKQRRNKMRLKKK